MSLGTTTVRDSPSKDALEPAEQAQRQSERVPLKVKPRARQVRDEPQEEAPRAVLVPATTSSTAAVEPPALRQQDARRAQTAS